MFQESIVDMLIRYGLFVGAFFQLICIGAVILIPDQKSDCFQETESCSDDEYVGCGSRSDSGSPSHSTSPNHSRGVKVKRDKKKRR